MYKNFTAAALLAVTAQSIMVTTEDVNCPRKMRGNNYKALDAADKLTCVKNELDADKSGTPDYFWEDMEELFLQNSNKTTCNQGDEMPNQGIEGLGSKQKLVHTLGVVGTVTYQADSDSKYSGILGEGADYGIVRLSDAGFLIDPLEDSVFTPSAAIKFFVNGESSRNLLLQFNFDGVEDDYFWANDLATHMKRSENQCNIDTVEKKFAEATKFTFQVGTASLANITQDGEEVDDDDVVFPFKVIAEPNRTAFPRPTELMDFMTYFESWEPSTDPTVLFDLYAIDDPEGEQEHMGQIMLTSNLYRSTWGDEKLFFQHHTINRDMKLLREQGDKTRAKTWKNALEKHQDSDLTEDAQKWSQDDVPSIGDDPEQAITDGIENFACPFAWLLQ